MSTAITRPAGAAGALTIAVLLSLSCLRPAAALAAEAEAEKGFTAMFNGKDLAGWEGEPGWWSVQDGAITGMSTAQKPLDHQSYLFWRGGKPGDFDLRADFRFLGPWGNSGINFRSQELPNWDVKGYQAATWKPARTGPAASTSATSGRSSPAAARKW